MNTVDMLAKALQRLEDEAESNYLFGEDQGELDSLVEASDALAQYQNDKQLNLS